MPLLDCGAFSRVTRLDPIEARLDYTKLRADLVRAVARLCPLWLSNQRDDVVQAALLRIMHVIEKQPDVAEGYRPLPTSNLYKAAHSALVDEIRRVRRRHETDL